MLLKFAIKNYKSFRDETVFSMEPAPKQKDLDYSVLSKKAGRKAYKGLCSAVIYGANASGKTNIIGAMEVLKNIISTGNISNHNINSPNIPELDTFSLNASCPSFVDSSLITGNMYIIIPTIIAIASIVIVSLNTFTFCFSILQ